MTDRLARLTAERYADPPRWWERRCPSCGGRVAVGDPRCPHCWRTL